MQRLQLRDIAAITQQILVSVDLRISDFHLLIYGGTI